MAALAWHIMLLQHLHATAALACNCNTRMACYCCMRMACNCSPSYPSCLSRDTSPQPCHLLRCSLPSYGSVCVNVDDNNMSQQHTRARRGQREGKVSGPQRNDAAAHAVLCGTAGVLLGCSRWGCRLKKQLDSISMHVWTGSTAARSGREHVLQVCGPFAPTAKRGCVFSARGHTVGTLRAYLHDQSKI